MKKYTVMALFVTIMLGVLTGCPEVTETDSPSQKEDSASVSDTGTGKETDAPSQKEDTGGAELSALAYGSQIDVKFSIPDSVGNITSWALILYKTEDDGNEIVLWTDTAPSTGTEYTVIDYWVKKGAFYSYRLSYEAEEKPYSVSSARVMAESDGYKTPTLSNVPSATYNNETMTMDITEEPVINSYGIHSVGEYTALVCYIDYEWFDFWCTGDATTGYTAPDWVKSEYGGKTVTFWRFLIKYKSGSAAYEFPIYDEEKSSNIPSEITIPTLPILSAVPSTEGIDITVEIPAGCSRISLYRRTEGDGFTELYEQTALDESGNYVVFDVSEITITDYFVTSGIRYTYRAHYYNKEGYWIGGSAETSFTATTTGSFTAQLVNTPSVTFDKDEQKLTFSPAPQIECSSMPKECDTLYLEVLYKNSQGNYALLALSSTDGEAEESISTGQLTESEYFGRMQYAGARIEFSHYTLGTYYYRYHAPIIELELDMPDLVPVNE